MIEHEKYRMYTYVYNFRQIQSNQIKNGQFYGVLGRNWVLALDAK